jgi:hypothetical protein
MTAFCATVADAFSMMDTVTTGPELDAATVARASQAWSGDATGAVARPVATGAGAGVLADCAATAPRTACEATDAAGTAGEAPAADVVAGESTACTPALCSASGVVIP